MKFTVQRHKLRKRPGPNHRTTGHYPFPIFHHHSTNSLFTRASFTQCIMSNNQEYLRHIKRQNAQFEETERASEPDMVGMLDYQTRNFKQLSSIS